ncbi:hypothetical protein [Streptomyces sp. NPDC002889]|uniref:hypothetical protein n=1 Tax=Streptomyces sp. NPDC002889 TaxID=3364669 RepID=UPI0036AE9703
MRLAADADADGLGRTLRSAFRRWWPDHAVGHTTLWSEPVPAAADSELAGRRLRAETHRRVGAPGPVFRAVLLRYADGPADLVLVAHRAALDGPSLRLIADVVLGRLDAWQVTVAPAVVGGSAGGPVAAGRGPRIEWATGDPRAGERTGVVSVPLPPEASPALLVAAAAVVLGRHESRETPRIGVVTSPPGRPHRVLGALDEVWVHTADLGQARTLRRIFRPPCAVGRRVRVRRTGVRTGRRRATGTASPSACSRRSFVPIPRRCVNCAVRKPRSR